eukprot:30980-Pelagococcus_subviridis.AAC.46
MSESGSALSPVAAARCEQISRARELRASGKPGELLPAAAAVSLFGSRARPPHDTMGDFRGHKRHRRNVRPDPDLPASIAVHVARRSRRRAAASALTLHPILPRSRSRALFAGRLAHAPDDGRTRRRPRRRTHA